MSSNIKTFWITFISNSLPSLFQKGCGVSAVDEFEALSIINSNKMVILYTSGVDNIKPINIDDVEKNHILPNVGNFAVRGIWYPNGI
jgi:hypothetical protein